MAHWIIEDHGSSGEYYMCSECKSVWTNLSKLFDGKFIQEEEHCPLCNEKINNEENEHVENTGMHLCSNWKNLRRKESML